MLRIAINGYGRIGRDILRALFERGLHNKLQIVAINDLGNAETLAHLTRFDSTFGRSGDLQRKPKVKHLKTIDARFNDYVPYIGDRIDVLPPLSIVIIKTTICPVKGQVVDTFYQLGAVVAQREKQRFAFIGN